MINIILIAFICTISLNANNSIESKKHILIQKQLKIEIEKEKKYSIEQTFYGYDNYDFAGSEINKESLESIPNLELDELDMDSVYD
ncbi:MAG TPA: hypothetical protein EYG73_07970 [Arcobacter sp.]|nr:hypothetical protein [Arcobacter sp.]